MAARRLLFVRPSRGARLAPIYLALLLQASASLIGLAAASWPEEPATPPVTLQPSTGRTFEGGMQVPQPERPPARRTHWM